MGSVAFSIFPARIVSLPFRCVLCVSYIFFGLIWSFGHDLGCWVGVVVCEFMVMSVFKSMRSCVSVLCLCLGVSVFVFYWIVLTTSAVSSANLGSILIFASCSIHRSLVLSKFFMTQNLINSTV